MPGRCLSFAEREAWISDACHGQPDGEHAAASSSRHLIQIVEDTLRERPIVDPCERKVHWHISAGDGTRVINDYVGDAPVTRASGQARPKAGPHCVAASARLSSAPGPARPADALP